jgi:hypothetical protein
MNEKMSLEYAKWPDGSKAAAWFLIKTEDGTIEEGRLRYLIEKADIVKCNQTLRSMLNLGKEVPIIWQKPLIDKLIKDKPIIILPN